MTLTELRTKANAKLTPLWESVQRLESHAFTQNGTYKAIPVRKLNIERSERFDVWGRVLADDTGYALQVLVVDEATGKQYARSQGYGTGTTFAWKEVSIGSLPTDVDTGIPNTLLVERQYITIPAHELTDPHTKEVTYVAEQQIPDGMTIISF